MGKVVSEKQLKANRQNAKLGGRPLADSTLKTQLQRKMLTVWLEPRLEKIFNALAEKAEKGDVPAIKELFDRAWGKPVQPLWHGDNEGNQIVFMPTQVMEKHVLTTGTHTSTS